MAITSSRFEVGVAQKDGRAYVKEYHSDAIGEVYQREYLANQGEDYTAKMNFYAAYLTEYLAQQEFETILNGT